MQHGGAWSRQQDKLAERGGITRTTAPSQDRTPRCLCADARREACACTGLDRRGNIVSPASPLARTSSAKAGKVPAMKIPDFHSSRCRQCRHLALDKEHGFLRWAVLSHFVVF